MPAKSTDVSVLQWFFYVPDAVFALPKQMENGIFRTIAFTSTRKSLSMRFLLFLFGLMLGTGLSAQEPIIYKIDVQQIHHHELNVQVIFRSIGDDPLVLHMPTSSPGRYAEHNFAKNVYDMSARGADGELLTVYRKDIDTWVIAGHEGQATINYTLFANRADGTYSGVDNRKLHLNMPATFLFAEGMEQRPVHLVWYPNQRPGWTVATQLEEISPSTFRAPNAYYFYDSPTFIGEIDKVAWTSESRGKEYTIEVAMIHEGTDAELAAYAEWVQAIVEEQKAVFGALPDFDFGRYTFLCSYNPWVSGDGMEHRNSTICSSSGNLASNASGLIGTISHEFFHAWNVERIRPKDLEPFDFTHANMSDALWFAEGFTSYYDDLILTRAGIRTPEEYAQGLTGTMNYVLNSPGRNHRNPVEMSRQAPFVDAASSIDPDNFANTFVSYYSYGSVLGLILDLEIRSRFPGKSLDDVMQYLWEHFGETEVPYEIPDLEYALAEVTGDQTFARNYFEQMIYRSIMPDVPALLAKFGVTMELANPGQCDMAGLNGETTENGVRITSRINERHSLYEAGINRNDVILTLDGTPVTSLEVLRELMVESTHRVTYLQNGKEESGSFVVRGDPSWKIMLDEEASQEALQQRADWLSGKSGN